jgi:hypothetical protein
MANENMGNESGPLQPPEFNYSGPCRPAGSSPSCGFEHRAHHPGRGDGGDVSHRRLHHLVRRRIDLAAPVMLWASRPPIGPDGAALIVPAHVRS